MADENPNARLMALTDGVVSIAVTLLVLDLRLPVGVGKLDDAHLWAALVALRPSLVGYLLSFVVIGSFWMNHRAKFARIVASDGRLLWLNMIFLLTIGVVPFTTNLLAESGGTLATVIYAATMLVSGLSLTWIWAHARRRGLIDKAMTKEDASRQMLSILFISGIFAISVPLSISHANIAKYVWLLILPVNLVLRRRAHRANTRSDA